MDTVAKNLEVQWRKFEGCMVLKNRVGRIWGIFGWIRV